MKCCPGLFCCPCETRDILPGIQSAADFIEQGAMIDVRADLCEEDMRDEITDAPPLCLYYVRQLAGPN